MGVHNWLEKANLFLLLSVTTHSISSSLQFVHGAPCSTTLHRTLRARQHWQAFDALLFTDLLCPASPKAVDTFLFAALASAVMASGLTVEPIIVGNLGDAGL